MANSFVGAGGGNGGTGATTYNFSSLRNASGITPTLEPTDLVLITSCRRHTANLAQTAPAGYSVFVPNIYSDGTTQDTNLIVFYKYMGPTPDTGFTLPASGVATGGSSFTVTVLRGAETIDLGSPQTVTGVGATAPDPPAVTPRTAGAWVFTAAGVASAAGGALMAAPNNISPITNSFQTINPAQAAVASGLYSGWVSGSYNPAAFGSGASMAAGSWAALTIAIKPFVTGGNMKVWNGSAWVEKPVKVWNGSAWVVKPLKVWNGSAWVLS